jgi:hypothetical protein
MKKSPFTSTGNLVPEFIPTMFTNYDVGAIIDNETIWVELGRKFKTIKEFIDRCEYDLSKFKIQRL